MLRALLALFLSLALAMPQGWAGVALYLCGGEDAIHVGEAHGDCCKQGCAHHEDDQAGACCDEMGDSDDRASADPDAPLPDLVLAGPPPEPDWPRPRVRDQVVQLWEIGPPPIGPPPWLRHRSLRL